MVQSRRALYIYVIVLTTDQAKTGRRGQPNPQPAGRYRRRAVLRSSNQVYADGRQIKLPTYLL